MDRRSFIKAVGATGALLALPKISFGATAANVIVIGGGFGGATCAKYLKLWGGTSVNVTLVDPNPHHVSCILSNMVVVNTLQPSKLNMKFNNLKNKYKVNIVKGSLTSFDPAGNSIVVQQGNSFKTLQYDHLVLSPGIDFVTPAGSWDSKLTPHAWIAGDQTTLLKSQLAAMKNGDNFVMNIPKSPYRCPPGPYERACVVADYLKKKKYTSSKVFVLDANASIQAEPNAFTEAFEHIHYGTIEYIPNSPILEINSKEKYVITANGKLEGKVINFIPNQKAANCTSGLPVTGAGFIPVDAKNYLVNGFSNIHVIGDSSSVPSSEGKAVPKSGHMANSEAKVCANAIIRSLAGLSEDTNITTASACYSPLTLKTASWLSANFNYGDIYNKNGEIIGTGMNRVDIGEAEEFEELEEMYTWANSLFSDSYL